MNAITNHSLWNRNFCLLVLANFFLFMSVYMLFPLLQAWIQYKSGLNALQAGETVSVFGIALFFSGPFNAYLIDRFKRKYVCIYSILCLAVVTLAYPYANSVGGMLFLRVLQGAFYGVALMSMGSTLVIDVTPSHHRDRANASFTWAGVIGMLGGIVVGIEGRMFFHFNELLMFSAGMSLVSVLLISLVQVCFRAPLNVPFLSFDRFLLFRTFLPGLNMMSVPVILGIILGMVADSFFYICMGGGFVVFLLTSRFITLGISGRLLNGAGLLMILISVGVLCFHDIDIYMLWGAGVLIGLGLGLSLFQFLRMMILLPLHCERGTGYHTFQLLWGIGVLSGYLLCQWELLSSDVNPFVTACIIGIAGLLYYQLYMHRYYLNKLKDTDII